MSEKIKVYHRKFNPKMETIQEVTADVDKMEWGYVLEKVVPVTEFEWIAVFVIYKEAEPVKPQDDSIDKKLEIFKGAVGILNELTPEQLKVFNESIRHRPFIEAEPVDDKEYPYCKDNSGNIIKGDCIPMADACKPLTTSELLNTMDAKVWAEEFNKVLVSKGNQPHDPGWLIGWFANAIMAGYDIGFRKGEAKTKASARIGWVEAKDIIDNLQGVIDWMGENQDEGCHRYQAKVLALVTNYKAIADKSNELIKYEQPAPEKKEV